MESPANAILILGVASATAVAVAAIAGETMAGETMAGDKTTAGASQAASHTALSHDPMPDRYTIAQPLVTSFGPHPMGWPRVASAPDRRQRHQIASEAGPRSSRATLRTALI